MASRKIRALLERQAVDLEHLKDREVRVFLRGLDDSRRELLARLADSALPDASRQQLSVALVQVEAMGRTLRQRMARDVESATTKLHDKAFANLLETVGANESRFRDHGSALEVATARRFAEERGLALHRFSLDRYGLQVVETAQRALVAGYLQGDSVQQLARRVSSVMQVSAARGELVVRMEFARAYDAGHQASLEELQSFDDPDTKDPLLKQAQEFLDARNHPFSRLLHGKTAEVKGEWRVPVSGGAARGLVWPVDNGVAHGRGYPAHYNDRGVQVAYRASWGS